MDALAGWETEMWVAFGACVLLAIFTIFHAVATNLANHARLAAFKREVRALRDDYQARLDALRPPEVVDEAPLPLPAHDDAHENLAA